MLSHCFIGGTAILIKGFKIADLEQMNIRDTSSSTYPSACSFTTESVKKGP